MDGFNHFSRRLDGNVPVRSSATETTTLEIIGSCAIQTSKFDQ